MTNPPCDATQEGIRAARMAQPITLRQATLLFAACAVWLLLVFSANGQNIRARRRAPDETATFLPPPRELTQELAKAQEDIEAERYVDAITRLDAILTGEGVDAEFSEDYFLEPKGLNAAEQTRISLKRMARQMIGNLPPAGRETYELQHGQDARLLLQQGVQQRDLQPLAQASRKFFDTRAGLDASMLLGRLQLQSGRPLEAILQFRRLSESTVARERFGAELPLLIATANQLAGREDPARAALADLRTAWQATNNQPPMRLGGKPLELPGDDEDPLQWLAKQIGSTRLQQQDWVREWKLLGGNPERTALVRADMPMSQYRWRLPVANDVQDESYVEQQEKVLVGTAPTPSIHPLVVHDTILMRSVDGMLAVDLQSGRRIWPYPWFDDSEQISAIGDDEFAVNGRRRSELVSNRVWLDSLFGQMSSDGDSIYLLDRLNDVYANSLTQVTNELAKLELVQSEGKLVWIAGGSDGDTDPKLAGVLFLGPPLPLGDELFCIVEVNAEIRLVVLDSATGKMRWSQQLAHLDGRYLQSRIAMPRRLAGANPSYSSGVLVCPTSAGGVAAIDVATRSFLWGYTYRPDRSRQRFQLEEAIDRWRDNSVVIADGYAVLTPSDSEQIHCLDLLTGETVWDPRPRGDNLFVGGVYDGKLLLVGKNSVSAIDLATGEDAWSLPLGNELAGRGVQSGSRYFLATQAPELLEIDLTTGKIARRETTDEPLGNLVAYDGQLISQSTKWLKAFYQRENLQTRVDRTLEKNPNDAWALEHRALLQLERGQQREGLQTLRQAVAAYESADDPQAAAARSLLVDSILALLRDDATEIDALAEEVRQLIDRPDQRLEFQRLVADRLQREGRLVEAFQAHLTMLRNRFGDQVQLEFAIPSEPMIEIERHRQLRQERWHQVAMVDLWNAADDSMRPQLVRMLEQAMAEWENADPEPWMSVFIDLPPAQPMLLAMMEASLDADVGPNAETELHLKRLAQTTDDQVAAAARKQLARTYLLTGRSAAAANLIRGMPDPPESLASQMQTNSNLKLLLTDARAWPFGQVEANAQEAPPRGFAGNPFPQFPRRGQGRIVPQGFGRTRYGRGNSSRNVPVELNDALVDPQLQLSLNVVNQQQFQIADSYGLPYLETTVPGLSVSSRNVLVISSFGHLLVVTDGRTVMAIDGLMSGNLVADRVLWRRNAGQPSRAKLERLSFDFGLIRDMPGGDSSGVSVVSLGPATSRGVVLRQWGDLLCLNPVTGDTLWSRDDVPLDSEVWGDEQHIFVQGENDSLVRIFRTSDGRELESRPGIRRDKRIRTYGHLVLHTRPDVNGNRLQLNDLFASYIWNKTFSADSKATFIGRDELAIYDPERGLFVIDVLTGDVLVQDEIKLEIGRVQHILGTRRAGRYVITLGETSKGRGKGNVTYTRPSVNQLLLDAELHAYDVQTGKRVWASPARLEHFTPTDVAARDLPVMVFIRKTQGSPANLETVVLDVRDGSLIFEHEGEYQQTDVVLSGDLETHQIQLGLPAEEGVWNLQFTDVPRPPRAPYGWSSPTGRTGSVVSRILRSIPFPSLGGDADDEDDNE